jgi:hypothetical protein
MAELGLELFARNRFDVKPTTNRLGPGVRTDHEAPVFQDFLNQILAAEIAGERHMCWHSHDVSVPAVAVSPPGDIVTEDAMEAVWKPQLPTGGLQRADGKTKSPAFSADIGSRPSSARTCPCLVMKGSGVRVPASALYKVALGGASLRALRFHDLRHTFGTRMIAKADIRRVQEWMGHADIQTTMRYLHFVPRAEDARLVAEAFAVDSGPAEGTSPDNLAGHLGTSSVSGGSEGQRGNDPGPCEARCQADQC